MGNAVLTLVRFALRHLMVTGAGRSPARCHISRGVLTACMLLVGTAAARAETYLPIPFFSNGAANGNGIMGGLGVTIVGPDGIPRLTPIVDFPDIHPLNDSPFYPAPINPVSANPAPINRQVSAPESYRTNASDGSGAVQVVNVFWLSDSQAENSREDAKYRVAQFAASLRMRDWQTSGMDGGSLECRESQDIADSAIRSDVFVDSAIPSNGIGVTYGVGLLGTERSSRTDFDSGFLDPGSYLANEVSNQIIGPKAGFVWSKSRGPLSIDLQSSLLLGINLGEVTDTSKFGGDITVPGALNRLLYATPTYSAATYERQAFSPVGEFRANSRFRLTRAVSLCTTWSTLFVGNVFQETSQLRAGLPEPAFLVDNEDVVIHQFYCGVEYLH